MTLAAAPREVLLQQPMPPLAAAVAAAVGDGRLRMAVREAPLAALPLHAERLRSGECLPVGSSHWMRQAAATAGLQWPEWATIPRHLASFVLHQPEPVSVLEALALPRPALLAPRSGRPFAPFLLGDPESAMAPHAQEQFARLLELPGNAGIWASSLPELGSVARYLVLRGDVIAVAGAGGGIAAGSRRPDLADISAMVAAMPLDAACVLEVGVLPQGPSTLLRLLDPLDTDVLAGEGAADLALLRLIATRWSQLVGDARRADSSLAT